MYMYVADMCEKNELAMFNIICAKYNLVLRSLVVGDIHNSFCALDTSQLSLTPLLGQIPFLVDGLFQNQTFSGQRDAVFAAIGCLKAQFWIWLSTFILSRI